MEVVSLQTIIPPSKKYIIHKIHSNKLIIVYMIKSIQNSSYYHKFCPTLATEAIEYQIDACWMIFHISLTRESLFTLVGKNLEIILQ